MLMRNLLLLLLRLGLLGLLRQNFPSLSLLVVRHILFLCRDENFLVRFLQIIPLALAPQRSLKNYALIPFFVHQNYVKYWHQVVAPAPLLVFSINKHFTNWMDQLAGTNPSWFWGTKDFHCLLNRRRNFTVMHPNFLHYTNWRRIWWLTMIISE